MMTAKLSAKGEHQRARLLTYLKEYGRISTLEARQKLDILAPAPRILELRRKGENIIMHWIIEDTQLGRHRVGMYVLTPKI